MKKTLRWSILFCLLLLCVMIPVTAQRAWAADYDLWVGGKQANSGNLNDILGDGTGSAKFDPDSNTLTLKDPKITAGYDLSGDTVLVYSKDIDLTVQGTAELKLAGAAASVYIEGGGLTVTGEDTEITAEADRTGIYTDKGLTVAGGKVNAKAVKELSIGILAAEEITVSGDSTVVYAEGMMRGITTTYDVTVKGGTVTAKATGKGGHGIDTSDGSVKISGGAEVTATATGTDGSAIYSKEGDITISGANTVVTADGVLCAIFAENGNTEITGGTVTATATDIHAIYSGAGDITISGEKTVVTAEGDLSAIYDAKGNIEITGGAVTAKATGKTPYNNAIYASEGDITISGDNTVVTAEATASAMTAKNGDITISGSAEVTATATGESGVAIYPEKGNITIEGGEVKASSSGENGVGIAAGKDVIVKDGEVTVESTDADSGIHSSGNIEISGGKVDVTVSGKECDGIIAAPSGTVTVKGGEVNVPAEGEKCTGIRSYIGELIIEGGKVSAEAKGKLAAAILGGLDGLTVKGGEVTAAAEGENSVGVESYGDITFSGADTVVTADGEESAISADEGTITIESPLDIVEPTGGKLDKAKQDVCTMAGKISPHAVIRKAAPTPQTFTVTWRNYDGTVLEVDAKVPCGAIPSYDGAAPKRPSTSVYTYTFSGWKPALAPVTEDVTYTASFSAGPNFGPGGVIVPGGFIPGVPGLPPGIPGTPGTPGTPGGTTPGGTTPGDGSGTPGGTALPFTDVTPDSPFFDDIRYVYENDIMNGMSSTTFGENLPLTRGMIVTILHRVEGRPEVAYTGAFTDVPDGMWYTDGVEWAASHGIVLGYGNGKYGPDDNVTREQLAAILFRYAKVKGYDVSVGEDTNILSYYDAFTWGDWAVSALQWACGAGVLEDSPVGMLRPADDATRGEIARAIHVFCEKVAK